jgi:hypothetical protein
MVFELVKTNCCGRSEFFFFSVVVTLVFSHIFAVSAIQQIQKVLHTLKQREQVLFTTLSPLYHSPLSLSAPPLRKHYLDKLTPHVVARWCVSGGLLALYGVRVYVLEGFYIVSYGLAIYLLNLLLGFISPKIDPEFASLGIDDDDDSVAAPLGTTSASAPSAAGKSDEFKPFIRRLPEFKFWLAVVRASALAIVLTLFPFLDIPGERERERQSRRRAAPPSVLTGRRRSLPVFWPILVLYFCMLFFVTMRKQIQHMIKHKYLPFSFG